MTTSIQDANNGFWVDDACDTTGFYAICERVTKTTFADEIEEELPFDVAPSFS